MKYKFILLASLLIICLTASECKKRKMPINPIDQLPSETQTSANTFGCLVNGKVFLPKGPSLSPILQCAYQYLNTNYSKGYFFQLSANAKGSKECELFSISWPDLSSLEYSFFLSLLKKASLFSLLNFIKK